MSIQAPPNKDQIEVTLLGPGYGESSLIHICDNNWIVIDSCIDIETGKPAALSYLENINVNPSDAIKLIIVTHWHDDHIRGMSEIIQCCPNAEICFSSALTRYEFLTEVLPYEERHGIVAGPGVRELFKIHNIIKDRRKAILRATADRRIFTLPCKEYNDTFEVWTLSPSDKQYQKFLDELTMLMPDLQETKRRVVSQRHNHISIVTLIEIAGVSLLFGGDMEAVSDPEIGWSVIVSSKGRPQTQASIFKVPHHGSDNAHNDDVWKDMLTSDPFAILTPNEKCRNKRPTVNDVRRISGYTEQCYSTTNLRKTKSKSGRDKTVARTLKESGIKITGARHKTGTIRLRNQGPSGINDWKVELFNSACHLKKVHS